MIFSLRVFPRRLFTVAIPIILIVCVTLAFVIPFKAASEQNIESNALASEDYIKWVDFRITSEILKYTIKLDINSQTNDIKLNFIELLSIAAVKNGGDFKSTKTSAIDTIVNKINSGKQISELVLGCEKYYNYYNETYRAALGGFVGDYEVEVANKDGTDDTHMEMKYGVKVFSPIAKSYPYSHYDDFGNSRSYGFSRKHLGNDLLGQVGTPIVAVESGVVEAMGWNQYGGWRIGIRSLDTKRYYYYAHLRKGYPYKLGLKEGNIIQAGDVIGYMGRTGYSTTEDKNNIETTHLHFGMQLIFDESQKECNNEIWINVYEVINMLDSYRSQVAKINLETKDYERVYEFKDLSTPQ
ncbi:MAG: M23 family metallopeptidase [Oscillospiraceae bacterium]|nr:M23 family metallopeptidase [Oscillospiraceae bacterium]